MSKPDFWENKNIFQNAYAGILPRVLSVKAGYLTQACILFAGDYFIQYRPV